MCYYKQKGSEKMNRSALCIKMLQILNAHDFVTTRELAERLEVNPRNIAEYKKELETAGYVIESVKGRYGGYRLDEKALLPSVAFSPQEIGAIREAYAYLKSHSDFLLMPDFTSAFEKLEMALSDMNETSKTVYRNTDSGVSAYVEKMIHICEEAKKNCQAVSFEYRSLKADKFTEVELCPYEILNMKGEYYCLGYNRNKQSFRTYKFSTARMRHLKILEKKFTRDLDFHLNDYIGDKSIIKNDEIYVEFLITGPFAVLYSEREIGIASDKWLEEQHTLHVCATFEGKMSALQFLCSLGRNAKVIAPKEVQEEIQEEIRKMAQNYL